MSIEAIEEYYPERWYDGKGFLIWSYEHASWWKPDERGYTKSVFEAGTYSYKRAREIVEKSDGEEVMVLKGLAFDIVRAERTRRRDDEFRRQYEARVAERERLTAGMTERQKALYEPDEELGF